MAYGAFDGVSPTMDVAWDIDGPSGSAAVSTKCFWRVVTTTIIADLFVYVTFCSGGWEEAREGLKRMLFTLLGYMGGGSVYAAPGAFMGLPAATTITITYKTGCTITGSPKVASDENTMVAWGETARTLQGRFSGEPVIVWVTV